MNLTRPSLWLIGVWVLVGTTFVQGQNRNSKEEKRLEQAVKLSVTRNVVVEVSEGMCAGIIYQTNEIVTLKDCGAPAILVNGALAKVTRVGEQEGLLLLSVPTPAMDRIDFNLDPSPVEEIFFVGNPGGIPGYVSFGRVTLRRSDGIMISPTGTQGMYGGGVYSYDGRLVGIADGTYNVNDAPLCGSVIPSGKVKAFVEGATYDSSK